jgi:hypothetical protein
MLTTTLTAITSLSIPSYRGISSVLARTVHVIPDLVKQPTFFCSLRTNLDNSHSLLRFLSTNSGMSSRRMYHIHILLLSLLSLSAAQNATNATCTCGIKTGLFCGSRATAAVFLSGDCNSTVVFGCAMTNASAVEVQTCNVLCVNDFPGHDHCIG